jgi:hypothetical protein
LYNKNILPLKEELTNSMEHSYSCEAYSHSANKDIALNFIELPLPYRNEPITISHPQPEECSTYVHILLL